MRDLVDGVANMKLRIAENLSLPVELVTQAIAIIAKRRAGKSYLMRRLVEQLHLAGQQVVLVDPKGDQWGIRSAADGKAAGLPFVILGGERGDAPLEAGAGEVVAQLVVKERVSAVLDLSLFRKHEVATFMTAFLENLYRLKAQEVYRTPVMLVIDEADAIAPQKPQAGEERMLGAAEDIVRRGGQRGLGCVLVTQRSAVLAKNVLTQAEVLIALRTIAPQDLAAMNAWIDVHGSIEQKKTLMESLPSLPVGDAWVWSPGWPTSDGIFKHVHVLPIETFDSGATPKPGEKRREPKTVADVDLEALKRKMAETIERKKADDPRELRRQIAELKKELGTRKDPIAIKKDPVKVVEKPVITDKQLERVDAMVGRMEKAIEKAQAVLTAPVATLRLHLVDVLNAMKSIRQPALPMAPRPPAAPTPRRAPAAAPPRPAPRLFPPAGGSSEVTEPMQRILDSLAWWESAGVRQASREQAAFVARYSVNGHFNNTLGTMKTNGLVEYPAGNCVALTDEGRRLARAPESAPDRAELIARTTAVLRDEPPRRIFTALVQATERELSREQLALDTGYTVNGHFNNTLGRLRSLGLVTYPRGNYVALSELFDALS